MKKIRGFFLKHRVLTLFCRRKHPRSRYRRIDPDSRSIFNLFGWCHHLKTKAKAIRNKIPMSSHVKTVTGEKTPFLENPTAVPKGKLAVYVGKKDEDFSRVLVPVIYLNHPLFTHFLREAEEEFGYNHPGGITIPCRMSEFENVKTRIAAGK